MCPMHSQALHLDVLRPCCSVCLSTPLLSLSFPSLIPHAPLSLHSFPCSPQMAYIASSPVFSDKERYPNFYRAIPPEPPIQYGKGIFIDHFKWTEVALIVQNEHVFSSVRTKYDTPTIQALQYDTQYRHYVIVKC